LIRVDWLSFSVDVGAGEGRQSSIMPQLTGDALRVLDADLPTWLGLLGEIEPGRGRAPYTASWSALDGGVTVFTSPVVPHALVEVSGRGCETLLQAQVLDQVMSAARDRITRIDIALDFETPCRPTLYAAQRQGKRFTAHSEVVSASGETVYIGSRKSDRYARVYRYNAPHPRSNLLRCEFSIKGAQSRITALHVLTDGIQATARALEAQFGWIDLEPAAAAQPVAEVRSWRPERREGKTVYWLNSQVAAALIRLHRDGVIDVQEWFQEAVLSQLDDSGIES
jgi:hypothetical protein